MDHVDGEQFYYQLLLKNIAFRNFNEFISEHNISKTFHEECILKNIMGSLEAEDENSEINNYHEFNLRDEATQLFIKNNICNNKNYIQFYNEENVVKILMKNYLIYLDI